LNDIGIRAHLTIDHGRGIRPAMIQQPVTPQQQDAIVRRARRRHTRSRMVCTTPHEPGRLNQFAPRPCHIMLRHAKDHHHRRQTHAQHQDDQPARHTVAPTNLQPWQFPRTPDRAVHQVARKQRQKPPDYSHVLKLNSWQGAN
jgi:hypothetical protein